MEPVKEQVVEEPVVEPVKEQAVEEPVKEQVVEEKPQQTLAFYETDEYESEDEKMKLLVNIWQE